MFVLNTVSCMSQSYSSLLRIPSVVGSQGSKLSTTTVIRVRFCFCPPTRRGTASAHGPPPGSVLSVAWDESTLDLDSCAENVSLAPNDPIAHVSNTRMMQCWPHPTDSAQYLSLYWQRMFSLSTNTSFFVLPCCYEKNWLNQKAVYSPKRSLTATATVTSYCSPYPSSHCSPASKCDTSLYTKITMVCSKKSP